MSVIGLAGLFGVLLSAAAPVHATQCQGEDWALIPTETIDIPVAYLHDRASGAIVVIGKGPSPLLKSRVAQVARGDGATVNREVRDGWVSEVAVQPNATAVEGSGLACRPSLYCVEVAAQLESKAVTLQATAYACSEAQRLRLLQLLGSPSHIWDAVRAEWPASQRVSEAELSRVQAGMCWDETRALLGTPTLVRRERWGFNVSYAGRGSLSNVELIFDQARRLAKVGRQ